MNFRIPAYFSLLARVYVFNLFLFFLCRLFFFIAGYLRWPQAGEFTIPDLCHAFLIGVQFDTVALAYILLIPFLLLAAFSFLPSGLKPVLKPVIIFLFCILSLSLLIQIINIPYFLQFFSPLSSAAFLWIDSPDYTLNLIIQENTILVFILPVILLISLEYLFLRKQYKSAYLKISSVNTGSTKNRIPTIAYLLLGCLLLFGGMRGRISGKATIQTGSAFFSENGLLNNTGLNPVFTLFHSILLDLDPGNAKVQLMNTDEAVKMAASFLIKDAFDTDPDFPLARHIQPATDKKTMNIVIVIMEAMSKFKMGKWGGPQNLTPNLNSLTEQSYYFDQIYTAGIHTFNGIYSTLFSFPALYKQHPLKLLMQVPHDGLANILKKENYQTTFFTTHDPEFDNVQGFLMANGFDKVYSEFDYPSDWIQSTNGVPDHKMFEYAIPQLNAMALKQAPFLSVFMTTSDHGPYIIPDGINFKPKSKVITDQIVEYADWSLGEFMQASKKSDWFNNTIFVFVADHGLSMGHTYDMPLSFHETPLIFYAPEFLKETRTFTKPGGQIDVAPTLLGLLNIPYVNNTPGIDLLKEERPFMYFCADDRIGCIDESHYFIRRNNGVETLFEYKNLDMKNRISSFPQKVDSMKKYTYSMMQCCQWMIDNNRMKYKGDLYK